MANYCHDSEQIGVDEPSCLAHGQCSEVVVPGGSDGEEQPLNFPEALGSGNNFPKEFLGASCVSRYDLNLYAVHKAQMRRLQLKVTGVACHQ